MTIIEVRRKQAHQVEKDRDSYGITKNCRPTTIAMMMMMIFRPLILLVFSACFCLPSQLGKVLGEHKSTASVCLCADGLFHMYNLQFEGREYFLY